MKVSGTKLKPGTLHIRNRIANSCKTTFVSNGVYCVALKTSGYFHARGHAVA
jgi:hypothetical protein